MGSLYKFCSFFSAKGSQAGHQLNVSLRISPRDRLVLTAIIEIYIATGEPVASQAIALQLGNKDGLGAATVRNVMSSLSDQGLLDQPHSSAGRIPTAEAFRFYVDQLTGQSRPTPGRPSPAGLTQERKDQIEGSFAGVNSRQQFLERTSHVLAVISNGVGVAIAPASEFDALEHIHFSRLTAARVLAVVVTKAGVVLDRVLVLDHDLTASELDAAAQFLNQSFYGWSIERIRVELSQRVQQERSEYNKLMQSIDQLCRNGAFDPASGTQIIFVEGVGNLIGNEEDRDRLRDLLGALEAKQRLIELLNAYVDARQQTVRVVVGLEDAMPEMRNLVLIGAPAFLGTESVGSLAVIGPTRIQYQDTMNVVSFIAQLSDRILQPPQ
jgi:heat-inducible transcriptional repressor